MSVKLIGGQIKLRQTQTVTDGVADMGVEEECHPLAAQVAVAVLFALHSVDLGVSVQVPHALDIHHDHLVTGPLKREVAESLVKQRVGRDFRCMYIDNEEKLQVHVY